LELLCDVLMSRVIERSAKIELFDRGARRKG